MLGILLPAASELLLPDLQIAGLNLLGLRIVTRLSLERNADRKDNQIVPWSLEGPQNRKIFAGGGSDAVKHRGYSSVATWEVAGFNLNGPLSDGRCLACIDNVF